MRSSWQEWIIAVGIVAIAVTGVLTIWGEDLFGTSDETKKLEAAHVVVVPAPGPAPAPAKPALAPPN